MPTYELISLATKRFPQHQAFLNLPNGGLATAPRGQRKADCGAEPNDELAIWPTVEKVRAL